MKRVLFAIFLAVPVFAQSTPQQPTINDTIVVTASSLPETLQATPAAAIDSFAIDAFNIALRSP